MKSAPFPSPDQPGIGNNQSSTINHQFLCRHWFLLALVFGVGFAVVWPQWLRPVVAPLSPQGVVAVALFLIAWGLESRSLGRALLRPLPALGAMVLSYGVLPALAWLTGQLIPKMDYRVGLLIVTSGPCTLASAVLWTRMAGGREATALLTILLTTATSWLITPAWLAWTTGASTQLDTAAMMRELLVVLVTPVCLGQLTRAAPPLARLAERGRAVLGVLSRLLILVIILRAATEVALRLRAQAEWPSLGGLLGTAGLCWGLHLTALGLGLAGGTLLGVERANRIAIAFSGSQKALPVALLLFETYFQEPYPLAVVPVVLYPLGQLTLDTLIAERLAQRRK